MNQTINTNNPVKGTLIKTTVGLILCKVGIAPVTCDPEIVGVHRAGLAIQPNEYLLEPGTICTVIDVVQVGDDIRVRARICNEEDVPPAVRSAKLLLYADEYDVISSLEQLARVAAHSDEG